MERLIFYFIHHIIETVIRIRYVLSHITFRCGFDCIDFRIVGNQQRNYSSTDCYGKCDKEYFTLDGMDIKTRQLSFHCTLPVIEFNSDFTID